MRVVQLWLELARTFLALQQMEDAQFCVQQAKDRAPASPATHYMEGRTMQVHTPIFIPTNTQQISVN